jgi:hypothetical protein
LETSTEGEISALPFGYPIDPACAAGTARAFRRPLTAKAAAVDALKGCTMPRPTKVADERRSEALAFRLTPAERLRVEHAAIEAGLSASEYARELTLKGRIIVEQRIALDPAVFDQLRRIGVNLNQLARIVNQSKQAPPELARACAAVENFLMRELDAGSLRSGPSPDPAAPAAATVSASRPADRPREPRP